MWSKGAVVIVKHGDPSWADEMAESIRDIQDIPLSDRMKLQNVQNDIYKQYYTRYWARKIRKAKRKYGYNKSPSTSKIGGALLYAWAYLTNAGNI